MYGAHGILPAKPDIAQRTPQAFLGSARQDLLSWVSGMLTELASLLGEVILGVAGLGEMGLRRASGYPILQPQKDVWSAAK